MPTVPPPRPAPRTDPDLRTVGLIVVVLMLAAAIAGTVWMRAAGARGEARHGGEEVGATFASFDDAAVVVDSVRADGAARRSGLLVGDVIETVDDRSIPNVEAADRAFLPPVLDIRVRRGKREIDLHLDRSGGDMHGQKDPVDRG